MPNNRMIPIYDPLDANGNIIADPSRRQQIQCGGVLNVICPDRIDPIAKAVQSVLPSPTDPDQPLINSAITNNAIAYNRSHVESLRPFDQIRLRV